MAGGESLWSTVMSDASETGGHKQQKRDPRHSFRAKSHAQAHAAEETPAADIPDHPLIPKGQAKLISTPQGLTELIAELRRSGSFAYDSEFIGELSYHPKLCLVQVATHEHVTLIDPLAEIDLTGFWELIADPTVEKILHAGEQDLEPVVRILGRPPANVIDVQVAAGFTGLAYPSGLSKLVREMIGARLGKGFTFTHWDQRPLSPVQLRYAADDVRYLPAVRDIVVKRLEKLGHLKWAKEECAALCDPARYRLNPAADYVRIRGAGSLDPKNAAVLRELYIWREDAALRNDSPPRSYVKDEVLLDIARRPVKTVADLNRVKGLPRPVENEEGQRIVEAVQRGLATPEAERPTAAQFEETPTERFAADSLWAVVQAWCYGQQVDPALLCSRQEIGRLSRNLREAGEPSPDGRLMHGWRGEMLGEPLRRMIRGDLEMRLRFAGGSLITAAAQSPPQ
jgi:ribonuclease D